MLRFPVAPPGRRVFLAFVFVGFTACQDGTVAPETGNPEVGFDGVQLVVPDVSWSVLSAPSRAPGLSPLSPVIFDQGPSTGTQRGCFVNQTNLQNFAEQFSFPIDMLITDIHIWGCACSCSVGSLGSTSSSSG